MQLTSLETSFLDSKFLTGFDEGARLLGPRTARRDSVILLLKKGRWLVWSKLNFEQTCRAVSMRLI